MQNKKSAKYTKIKANDKFAKRYILQILQQAFEYLRFFENQRKNIKPLKLKKLIKKRFDEEKFDKYI